MGITGNPEQSLVLAFETAGDGRHRGGDRIVLARHRSACGDDLAPRSIVICHLP